MQKELRELSAAPPDHVLRIMAAESEKIGMRIAAISLLPNLDIPHAKKVQAALGLLQSEAKQITSWAILQLELLGGEGALKGLRTFVKNESDLVLVGKALRALGHLGDDGVIEAAAKLIRSRNRTLVMLGAQALSSLGTDEAKAALEGALEALKDTDVAWCVAVNLARHGIDVARPYLRAHEGPELTELSELARTVALANLGDTGALHELEAHCHGREEPQLFPLIRLLQVYSDFGLRSSDDPRHEIHTWIARKKS